MAPPISDKPSASLQSAPDQRVSQQAVAQAGLIYVSDGVPGITRVRSGDAFEYRFPNGQPVSDEATLERIRSLAIPPAYERVWICLLSDGHLQATGRDARGRKQYRYHPRFRETRDANKFDRMVEFGSALPRIHERVESDLRKRGLPREKVLAAVVHLLERSMIRVGNDEYAKDNKSYGLTTIRNRHVRVEGSEIRFRFSGKSNVKHEVTLQDRRLARLVAQLQELPGQELFGYVDESGNVRDVTSNDVNAYLKEIAGGEFTAKDFRTWAGTVLALSALACEETPGTAKEAKRTVAAVVKEVARQLGNTPAVCRKCYVHPAVLEEFGSGRLREILAGKRGGPEQVAEAVQCAEEAVLKLLRRHRKEIRQAVQTPTRKTINARDPGG